ncbi:MAG: NAD(P)/FAD-dependent oxidoreductase [Candidatus Eisenbacteria bacterium]|nr:NAD(P)/FAD-dependent oxidoreductase [Candidatus Eisenbacteria bacterium]
MRPSAMIQEDEPSERSRTMNNFAHVILGGGVSAGHAVKELVTQGVGRDALCLISAENDPPYERPPLSKGLLRGKISTEKPVIHSREFYEEHGIALMLNTSVEAVDFDQRRLVTQAGPVGFKKLLLVTGSQARLLDCPGVMLEGVIHLRTLADARRILERLDSARRATVIGGGFIGSEVSASLRSRGLEIDWLYREDRILEDRPHTPEMSASFEEVFRGHGVTLHPNDRPKAFQGDERVERVLTTGGQELPTDLVVVGIGATPHTELFEGSPVDVDGGILVNEQLETSVADVFAAGDVVRYPDPRFGRLRVEHWDTAVRQARHAARAMLGNRESYEELPYYFSDVFDLSWEYWGHQAGADTVVYRGNVKSDSFSAFWLRDGAVVAAFVMGRSSEEREAAQKMVASGAKVSAAKLEDQSAALPA